MQEEHGLEEGRKECAQAMVDEALVRGSKDNTTATIIWFLEDDEQ